MQNSESYIPLHSFLTEKPLRYHSLPSVAWMPLRDCPNNLKGLLLCHTLQYQHELGLFVWVEQPVNVGDTSWPSGDSSSRCGELLQQITLLDGVQGLFWFSLPPVGGHSHLVFLGFVVLRQSYYRDRPLLSLLSTFVQYKMYSYFLLINSDWFKLILIWLDVLCYHYSTKDKGWFYASNKKKQEKNHDIRD